MQALTQLVGVLVAVVGIPVALERFAARTRLRSSLTTDAALLDKLPKDSDTHAALLEHLDQRVRQLIALEAPGVRYRVLRMLWAGLLVLIGAFIAFGAYRAGVEEGSQRAYWLFYLEAGLLTGFGAAMITEERRRVRTARAQAARAVAKASQPNE